MAKAVSHWPFTADVPGSILGHAVLLEKGVQGYVFSPGTSVDPGTIYFNNTPYSLATDYGLDGPGIESRWGRDFPPVQTGPGPHPASYTTGTGAFRGGVNYDRGVLLTPHPLLVSRSWKSRAIPLPTLWATTGPATGALYHTFSVTIGTVQCGQLVSSLNKHLLTNENDRVFVTAENLSTQEVQRPGQCPRNG